MKNVKLFLSLIALVAVLLLSSCDVVYDYVMDDVLGQYGDMIFGDDQPDDGDGDGEQDGADLDDEQGGGELGGDEGEYAPHVCVFGEWETVIEASCEETGLAIRECQFCDEYEERLLDLRDHKSVYIAAKAPTCTESGATDGYVCEECKLILSGINDVPSTGHTEVVDPATPGDDTTPAKTEGRYCSECGFVILRAEYIYTGRYTTPDSYKGDYAYEYLAGLANGDAMREFYAEIDEALGAFHHSNVDATLKSTKGGDVYMVEELTYSDNGLTNDEAIAVWCAFKMDHPLYYWMSNEISYNVTNGTVSILTYEEYALGEVRISYNEAIYSAVKALVEGVMGEGDYYRIALSIHDGLLLGADYAYEADGVTPSDDASAHNVIGVMLDGAGVCESYAKSFQLLLNYFNIENVYVSGFTTEAHAWNLVQLDDGEWYWFDLTWDDRPTWGGGIVYNYFCVTDDTVVNAFDATSAQSPITMAQNHFPNISGSLGTSFFYSLPERSDSEYDYDTLKLRDEVIVIDGLSYVLVGFREVALIEIAKEGDVVIPETITVDGIELKVVTIGAYANGLFKVSGVVKMLSDSPFKTVNVTSVSIPRTVRFIFDNAFTRCNTIKEFIVDEDNPYFRDYSGALFTKSLYTLIAYPFASEADSFALPEQTREIAYYALGDGGNVLYAKNLRQIIGGDALTYVGVFGSVYGYADSERVDDKTLSLDEGYLQKIFAMYPFLIV